MTIQDMPPYFIQRINPIHKVRSTKNETNSEKSFDSILKQESEKYNEKVTKELNVKKNPFTPYDDLIYKGL